ncbi:MAG: TonB-dependent receptor [Flavobacteriales bacterium]
MSIDPYIIHLRSLWIALLLLSGALSAQTTVEVLDNIDGKPVPFAVVRPETEDHTGIASKSTDLNGRAVFSDDELFGKDPAFIRIEALGYEVATIPALMHVTFALKRDPQQLKDAVVTGQYGPTSADNAVHKVRVINEAQLQARASNTLADALQNELNIQLSQDNILGTSMSMQGLSGQNVKILIDGVPVIGRQNGNIDLAQMDLNGIAHVEIVEGPLSVSYGTNALAGTINLITKKNASEAPTFKFSSYAEHIGRLNLWGTAAKRWGKHNVNINLGRDYFNGWNPGQTGIPNFGPALADTLRYQQWKPREQYTGRLNYRWNSSSWQLGYKAEVSNELITARGRPRAPYYVSAFDEEYRTQRIDNALFADHFWNNGRKLNLIIAHDRYKRTRNTWVRDLTNLGEQLVVGEDVQDTSRFTLTNARLVYFSAGEDARLRYEFGTDINYETGSGQRIVNENGASIGDYALYSSIEYKPWKQVIVRPAVRYSYNTIYDAPLVPSLNIRWQLDTAFTVRASYARGFRTPSLKELYFYFVDVNHDIRGNEDLNAEHSNNFSASLTWNEPREHGAWRAELSGFYNTINDLITLAQVDATLYTYVNIGQYRTAGGNLGVSWEGEQWAISAGGNVTGRKDDLVRDGANDFLWSHEARGSITRTWAKHGLSAQAFFKYQGLVSNYAVADDNTVQRSMIEAYSMADVSLTKELFKKQLGLTVGCKNLLDVQNLNASSSGVGGVHVNGGSSVPMMNGRLFFLRLNLELSALKK